jgi:arabinan endo-1,5-alpha-L-arabinosidase
VPSRLGRLVCAVALAVTLLDPSSASATRDRETAAPMIWERNFADPSVVEYYGGYLATGTGPVMPRVRSHGARGPWHELPSPLTTFPSWVLPGDQWAPHLQRVEDGTWVLYYSALVAGLSPGARCIGTATAATATGPFTPYGDAPLVCPPRLGAVPAEDQLLDRPSDLPASGVIDPSVFTERDGRLYLLYKTQGRPSSIRMVPLTPDGLHVAPGKRSKMLLRSNEIVENPALVHQGSHYVLFTSEGWYGECDYRTTWRKSRKKWSWRVRSTNFLGPEITGLCGPGGADVVVPRGPGRVRMYFHGWVCYRTRQSCPRQFRRDRDDELLPVRGMYGLLLDWGRSDAPQISDYLAPR